MLQISVANLKPTDFFKKIGKRKIFKCSQNIDLSLNGSGEHFDGKILIIVEGCRQLVFDKSDYVMKIID